MEALALILAFAFTAILVMWTLYSNWYHWPLRVQRPPSPKWKNTISLKCVPQNLIPLQYNDVKKTEIFDLLSVKKTHLNAQKTALSEVQKVKHVVSQISGKDRTQFAAANPKEPLHHYDYNQLS